MKIRLHTQDLKDACFEYNFPLQYDVKEQKVLDQTFNAELVGTKGSYRSIILENISIGYSNFYASYPIDFKFESDFETVEMHFALQGTTKASDAENKRRFDFQQGFHNIIYANGFKGSSEMHHPKSVQNFEVNLMPQFFKQYLTDDCQYFYQFLKNIQAQKTSMIYQKNFPITAKMRFVIQEILADKRVGMMRKMFLEAKVIELLMLQLEQIMATFATYSSLKPADKEKIFAVKDILDKKINGKTSLIDLAQEVGTNEFTLKKGFKELFGTTVFGYWNELKMNYAQKMLLEQDIPIYQVAEAIGYKNPQHFTTAFKKRYGIAPSTLKTK